MAAESNLWDSVRPRLQTAGLFCLRIETSTGTGVPDVWVGGDGFYAWVENKAQKSYPVRPTSKVFASDGLRKEQIAWHAEATRLGVRAFILAGVGVGQGRVLYLVPSSQGEHFNNFTRADLEPYRIQVELLPAILKAG